MKVKYFYKKNCPKCPSARVIVDKIADFEAYDIEDLDGGAEAAYYMVYAAPTVIVLDDDGREVRAWRGEIPEEAELLSLISA